jgi:hypothetical protein
MTRRSSFHPLAEQELKETQGRQNVTTDFFYKGDTAVQELSGGAPAAN